MQEFRNRLLPQLSAKSHDCVRLARSIQSFVDDAGKEATAKRERLRIIVSFVEEFLRGLLRVQVSGEIVGDESLGTAVREATANGLYGSTYVVMEGIESCMSALENVDRN